MDPIALLMFAASLIYLIGFFVSVSLTRKHGGTVHVRPVLFIFFCIALVISALALIKGVKLGEVVPWFG